MGVKSTPSILFQNASTSVPSTTSPWVKNNVRGRGSGCRRRPWVCRKGKFAPKRLCCKDLCVDVSSDKNNCGLCGTKCPFNWQCCKAFSTVASVDIDVLVGCCARLVFVAMHKNMLHSFQTHQTQLLAAT
ncbi:hypothetical protein V8G54_031831 [Vigna mungo]|uniref:Stigma-specific Stig1 family protein n=1 Tax=Vigna mungo TaxID=3915 RepID=A0AAQ3RHA7_VIGMU